MHKPTEGTVEPPRYYNNIGLTIIKPKWRVELGQSNIVFTLSTDDVPNTFQRFLLRKFFSIKYTYIGDDK